MPFQFSRLEIPDLILIEPKLFSDERGFLMEAYNQNDFAAFGINVEFVQDNLSRSAKGVLRGLHYQLPPAAQGKLVGCIRGEVFDVAVDIRKRSSTYGKWVGVRLSEENRRRIYIPPGFAHGFAALSEPTDILYKTTGFYAPNYERGIIWNDPALAIEWPVEDVILSAKDAEWPTLENAENEFL